MTPNTENIPLDPRTTAPKTGLTAPSNVTRPTTLGDPLSETLEAQAVQTLPAPHTVAAASSPDAPANKWSPRPFIERMVTNVAGVAVGYIGILVNYFSGVPSAVDELAIANAGALLIPVVGRLAGAANRRDATPFVLSLIRRSTITFVVIAVVVFGLATASKRHWWVQADAILQQFVDLWYLGLALGLIVDLTLVAAEDEKNERQASVLIRDLRQRALGRPKK